MSTLSTYGIEPPNPPPYSLRQVVSGGQTGVDRAALDVARQLGYPIGGWCPRGRRAEDGRIPAHYPLQETPDSDYRQRTRWNVRDSDGTLILSAGPLDGGTLFTRDCAKELAKPVLVLQIHETRIWEPFPTWLVENAIHILNVAGPRESSIPGIYQRTCSFLQPLLTNFCQVDKIAPDSLD